MRGGRAGVAVLVAAVATLAANSAAAAGSAGSRVGSAGSAGAAIRLAEVKARAGAAIATRQATLTADSAVVGSAVHLSAGDRATLAGLIAADQSGLSALGSTIDGDATVSQAVADAETIVTSYRIYALVDPKVHLSMAADRGAAVVSDLTRVTSLLEEAVAAERAAGRNVAAAQAGLADLQARTAAASAIVSQVPGQVLPLTPAGYPSNRTTLVAAAADLATARQDLAQAEADAHHVVLDLGGR